MKAPKLHDEEVLMKFFGKKVLKRTYGLPDGSEDYFYVFGGQVPVIIFAMTDDRQVIAVKQFRYGADEFILEVPGGVIKESSSPDATVRQELLDETGYEAGEIVVMKNPIYFDPASFTVAFVPCLAFGCRKVCDPHPEKTEIMEVVLIPFRQWLKMVAEGEIQDAKSIAMTWFAWCDMGGSAIF